MSDAIDPAEGRRHPDQRDAMRSLPALVWRLLRAWSGQLLALLAACGVVAATIAGALGVGDSLQNGLRGLALDRLGGITSTVLSDDFFRADMVRGAAAGLVPAIVLEVTIEAAASREADPRLSRATLLACDQAGELGFEPGPPTVGPDEVAINDVLANNLGVAPGDMVVLRITKRSDVPSDSPLGRRIPESIGRRLRVASILPPRGIGRFSLRPAQVTGGMALATLKTAQDTLRRGDVANAALAVGALDKDRLRALLHPTLADFGLALEEITAPGGVALRLASRKLLLPAEVDRVAAEVLRSLGGRPTLAFLVNDLAVGATASGSAASIPYSTLLAIDDTSLPVGGLFDAEGKALALPPADGIIIDQWVADDLAAQGHPVRIGDGIDLRMFRAETLHGKIEEATHTLRISGIARMEGAAIERALVPEVEGITDEKSIADWDPPFPYDRSRVLTVPPHDEDDRYWKAHGAAPKAFVSLATGRRLAASRFGATTAWLLPGADGAEQARIASLFAAAIVPERMGMRVQASRADALAAAQGSTPFGSLFLALSSFVVVAGLLLEWLLFHLLVAARRRAVGLLSAIGWPAGRITALLVLIGASAAAAGIVVGTALGPVWARLLLRALATSWNDSVAAGSTPAFGDGAIRWSSLWPGAIASAVLSLAAIAWAARRAARQSPLALLRGGGDLAAADRPLASRRAWLVAAIALVAALLVAGFAGASAAQTAVGMFFLSGMLALVGFLSLVRVILAAAALGDQKPLRSLPGLAWRGLAHRPSRAFSIAAIVAVAEFLIVAVSAFSLSGPSSPSERSGPTGGWTGIATFAQPTGIDPSDATLTEEMGLSDQVRRTLAGATIERIRASAGDDASCTNLYAPARPVVLGFGPALLERGGFRFSGHLPLPPRAGGNPWKLLGSPDAGPVPAILDDATARWALKLGGVGNRFTLPDDEGLPVEFQIVGLLEPGILQGYVIVAEADFERIFPARSGYSMALVDAGSLPPPDVDRAVRSAWIDAGVDLQGAVERLRSLSAVQNTFLAAFQALGTLGLLLGTAGVAAAQVQGVLERIGAFGLLGAVGFPLARLRLVVVLETLLMVGLGLTAGALAGAVTLPAHVAGGRAALPLTWIAATCGLTLLVALLAGLLATRAVARLSPREALAART